MNTELKALIDNYFNDGDLNHEGMQDYLDDLEYALDLFEDNYINYSEAISEIYSYEKSYENRIGRKVAHQVAVGYTSLLKTMK